VKFNITVGKIDFIVGKLKITDNKLDFIDSEIDFRYMKPDNRRIRVEIFALYGIPDFCQCILNVYFCTK